MKVVLMTGPRLTGGSQSHSRQARWETQMSASPVRSDWKYRLSSSGERLACASAAPVLIAARFTGADHGSWTLRRVETQISNALAPPGVRGRPELNRISFPSARTVTNPSGRAG